MSEDRWSWEEDAFPPVAFCVRALVVDGLRVAPFDQHGDGDGRLRQAGLDGGIWRAWLVAILRQRATLADFARTLGTRADREPMLAAARGAGEVLRAPDSFSPGTDQLRERLSDLWAAYSPTGEAWKRRMSEASRRHGSDRQQRALWKSLTPFHDRLPALTVFLVDYPQPAIMPLPPTSCLIAPADEPEAYARQVVTAATRLVEHRP